MQGNTLGELKARAPRTLHFFCAVTRGVLVSTRKADETLR
jgi:hypothetical protein